MLLSYVSSIWLLLTHLLISGSNKGVLGFSQDSIVSCENFLLDCCFLFVCFCVDMVVSGVPQENGILHASEIASMALDLVGVCHTFRIPHKPNTQLQIRAGIHSGIQATEPL